MTNLLEKVLLTGFGIFIVTLLFSLINPFIIQIFEIDDFYDNKIVPYLKVIDEINYGIIYIQNNQDDQFMKIIDYPRDLNITFSDFFAKFQFLINSKTVYRIYEYDCRFKNYTYCQLQSKDYYLNISFQQELVHVIFV